MSFLFSFLLAFFLSFFLFLIRYVAFPPVCQIPAVLEGATKRTVATAAKKEWLCILPDKPNVLELRKKVKQGHYDGVPALVQSGRIVAGGAMLDSHPEQAKEVPFRGSMIIYTGETKEEIRALIKEDVYAKSGVWDVHNAQIIPYVSAVREPLVKG